MWNPFAKISRSSLGGTQAATSTSAVRSTLHPGAKRQYEIANVEMIGEIAVATITVEELSLEYGVVMLADLMDELVDSGIKHLVLDIQNVRLMDSACVGCMVETLNKLARAGGRIALANPGVSVANLFRLTRLDRVFPICNDVFAAVAAVERNMGPR